MTVDEVIAAAAAQTGLSYIGDRSVLEGLERLLKAYAEEAKFTEQGSAMAHGDLVMYMANRMRIEDWLKRHPALLEAPIARPRRPDLRSRAGSRQVDRRPPAWRGSLRSPDS